MRFNTQIYFALLCLATTAPFQLSVTAQTSSASRSKADGDKTELTSKESKSKGDSKTKSRIAKPASKPTSSARQPSEADNPIDARSFNDTLLSRLVFDLTNAERRHFGLSEFKNNQSLYASATGHSRDMAARNYFEHKSKGLFSGKAPSDRIKATGYAPSMTAENIAMIPTFNSQKTMSYGGGPPQVVEIDSNSYNRLAVYSVQQWMQSPGHRKNILNPSLTEMGVGVAIGMKDNVPYVYLTQNFGG